jgi:hypothetical protein
MPIIYSHGVVLVYSVYIMERLASMAERWLWGDVAELEAKDMLVVYGFVQDASTHLPITMRTMHSRVAEIIISVTIVFTWL